MKSLSANFASEKLSESVVDFLRKSKLSAERINCISDDIRKLESLLHQEVAVHHIYSIDKNTHLGWVRCPKANKDRIYYFGLKEGLPSGTDLYDLSLIPCEFINILRPLVETTIATRVSCYDHLPFLMKEIGEKVIDVVLEGEDE